jgi:hypothetical protein
MYFNSAFLAAAAVTVAVVCCQPAGECRVRAVDKKTSYLDNGVIKLGVDLEHGGSIGYLAEVTTGKSVVNVHDLGRWIGQSYYGGPKPFGKAHPGWPGWPWNPVSAGDVYGHSSRILEHTNDGKTLYVKSVPVQWALDNVPADCTFETWITLDDHAAHVRNRLVNDRKDEKQYLAMDQEVPALYTVGTLHRLTTYTGDAPFADKPVQEIPRQPSAAGQPKWSTFHATEHWAALLNDGDWGLGLIHPGVVRFLGGFYGKPNTGGPADDPTGYIAPVRKEILDHNLVFEYRYSLVLGSLTSIRKEAYKQQPKSSLPDYRFKSDRQHWWYINAEDAGFPIKDALWLKVEKDDPQMYGPEGGWLAKEVPKIFIRAAYRTKNTTAELFWETTEKPGFAADQSVRFFIVPDGKFRTYEVDLSKAPTYRGTIRRLRFDPVVTGGKDETVDVEFISAKGE